MAKFCTKCGKPLVDGKPCSCGRMEEKCRKTVLEEEFLEQENKIDFITQFFYIIKKPKTASRQLVQEKKTTYGFYSFVLQSILTGLFVFVMSLRIGYVFTTLLGGLSNVAYMLTGSVSSGYQGNGIFYFAGLFFLAVILSFLTSFAASGIFWALIKIIGRVSYPFSVAVNVIGARASGICLASAVGIVFLVIYPPIGIICILVGNLAGFVFMLEAAGGLMKINPNRMIYIVLLTIILLGIVHIICIQIAGRLFWISLI